MTIDRERLAKAIEEWERVKSTRPLAEDHREDGDGYGAQLERAGDALVAAISSVVIRPELGLKENP